MNKSLFALIFILIVATAQAQITKQVVISRNSSSLGNKASHCASLSGDARYTLFESYASNLVPSDNNGRSDIFLSDNQTGALRLLSRNAVGIEQQGGENPTTCSSNISRDGSTVIYASDGNGLVDAAQANLSRLYSIDVASGAIELLTPGPLVDGVFFPSLSQDGQRVVFMSADKNIHPQANGLFQVYLLERPGNTITMLSVDENGVAGNGQSVRAEISHDGKWVAYSSKSSNLKGAGLVTNTDTDQIFLLSLESGLHTLISRSANGLPGNGNSEGADISADGKQVVFFSEANNLISQDRSKNDDVLLYDRDSGALELISVSSEGKRISGSHELLGNALSADGNLVMFRALLGSFDKFRIEVYVRDRKNSRTYLSSFSKSCSLGESGGDSHSGSIAPDAPLLAFAVGKDTSRSVLQLIQVGIDVLQNISTAPQTLDAIDADICRDSVTLAMTPFSLLFNSEYLAARLSNGPGISYETKIQRIDRKAEIKKYSSKRNILALNNLDPGNYSASYKVKVVGNNGTSQSKFSTATKFMVKTR